MKEVLIITGACGVGKTTTAKAWAKRKQGAIIECDYLTEWIFKKDFPHWGEIEEKFTAALASKMAMDYLDNDMSVAIENVWTPKGIALLRSGLKGYPGLNIKAVWLYCDRKENHRRDEQRDPADQMRNRVDIVNEELKGFAWPGSVQKLDTTDLSVEEILDQIEVI